MFDFVLIMSNFFKWKIIYLRIFCHPDDPIVELNEPKILLFHFYLTWNPLDLFI